MGLGALLNLALLGLLAGRAELRRLKMTPFLTSVAVADLLSALLRGPFHVAPGSMRGWREDCTSQVHEEIGVEHEVWTEERPGADVEGLYKFICLMQYYMDTLTVSLLAFNLLFLSIERSVQSSHPSGRGVIVKVPGHGVSDDCEGARPPGQHPHPRLPPLAHLRPPRDPRLPRHRPPFPTFFGREPPQSRPVEEFECLGVVVEGGRREFSMHCRAAETGTGGWRGREVLPGARLGLVAGSLGTT